VGESTRVTSACRRRVVTRCSLPRWRVGRTETLSNVILLCDYCAHVNYRWRARDWNGEGRLTPATGDSVLGLDLDWPARVAEGAPHFVAHSSTNFVRQGRQRLAGGSAAAFKRAVIRVE
jgi:hypothetical protein